MEKLNHKMINFGDEFEEDLADYFDVDNMKHVKVVDPAFSHSLFNDLMQAIENPGDVADAIRRVQARKTRPTEEDCLFPFKDTFPYMFNNRFYEYQIPRFGEVDIARDMHPFDFVENGVSNLGAYSIDPTKAYAFSSSDWLMDKSGFARLASVDHYDAELLKMLAPFCAFHSLQLPNGHDAPVWVASKQNDVDKLLYNNPEQVYAVKNKPVSNTRSMLPVPSTAKVSTVAYLYDHLSKADKPVKKKVTNHMAQCCYKQIHIASEKQLFLMATDDEVIYYDIKNDKPFYRPMLPATLTAAWVAKLVDRFNSLSDPFGPMWYTGCAYGKDTKVVFEAVNNIFNMSRFFENEFEVAGCKKTEPVALSLPAMGQKKVSFLAGQQIRKFALREDVRFVVETASGYSRQLMQFTPVQFPTINDNLTSEMIQMLIDGKLKEDINPYVRKYKVGVVRVDFRFAMYDENGRMFRWESNIPYSYWLDADPLSKYAWLVFGVDIQGITPKVCRHTYIAALQMRYDFIMYRLINRKSIATKYRHSFKVSFVFKDVKAGAVEYEKEAFETGDMLDGSGEDTEEIEIVNRPTEKKDKETSASVATVVPQIGKPEKPLIETNASYGTGFDATDFGSFKKPTTDWGTDDV